MKKQTIKGLIYLKSFITKQQENQLVTYLTEKEWNTSLKRRTQHYGQTYSYDRKNTLTQAQPIPGLFSLIKRQIQSYVKQRIDNQYQFDQIIINQYLPGQGISSNIDNPKLFDKIILSLSLNSDIIMNFFKPRRTKNRAIIIKKVNNHSLRKKQIQLEAFNSESQIRSRDTSKDKIQSHFQKKKSILKQKRSNFDIQVRLQKLSVEFFMILKPIRNELNLILYLNLMTQLNYNSFLELMSWPEQCSHIISIYADQQNPPKDKGNLYLSGVYVFDKPNLVNSLQINCVLSIIDKWTFNNYKVKEKLDKIQIKHHKWIDLQDYEDEKIYPHLDFAHTYIKDMLKDHNVLVHCQMGMSRSSSLVIAFLMKEYGMDYHSARIFAKNKRKIVQPNEGFQKDLLQFEEYLKQHHPNLFKK